MRFDHIEEARAWAFECIQRRPATTWPMQAHVMQAYPGQIGTSSGGSGFQSPSPASLERQIAEAEMLAQWVYAGKVPDEKGCRGTVGPS